MHIELSDRQASDNVMGKAKLFVQEVPNPPKKYTQDEKKQFLQQFAQLNDHERYTCAEIILSNAWGHINAGKKEKAKADLCFIIPLCMEKDKKQLHFPDFDIDRMLYQCWVNDQTLSQQKKQQNTSLMQECGFKVQQYVSPVKNKPKSGFQKFLQTLKCSCCGKRGS